MNIVINSMLSATPIIGEAAFFKPTDCFKLFIDKKVLSIQTLYLKDRLFTLLSILDRNRSVCSIPELFYDDLAFTSSTCLYFYYFTPSVMIYDITFSFVKSYNPLELLT